MKTLGEYLAEPLGERSLVSVRLHFRIQDLFHTLHAHCMFAQAAIERNQADFDARVEELRKSRSEDAANEYGLFFGPEVDAFPRLQWMSTFLLSYGVFETTLNSICKAAAKPTGIELTLKNINGLGIERAKIYLTKVCGVIGPFDTAEWQEIAWLNKLRNVVAHAFGEVDRSQHRDLLEHYKRVPTIRIVQEETEWERDEIVLTAEFVISAISTFSKFLDTLCNFKQSSLNASSDDR